MDEEKIKVKTIKHNMENKGTAMRMLAFNIVVLFVALQSDKTVTLESLHCKKSSV